MELQPITNGQAVRFSGGEKVGVLTIVKALGSKRFRRGVAVVFECRCDCGLTVQRDRQALIKSRGRYCGTTCGLKGYTSPKGGGTHPLFPRWKAMIARCTNPKNKSFPDYGAKGIAVCQRWLTGEGDLTGFECFIADMGEPGARMTLERRDSAAGYEPGNCQWDTRTAQSRNRGSLRMVSWRGETHPLSVWAERQGVPYFTLVYRVKKGWPLDRAMLEPVKR